ncbi:hypothetical protein RB620_29680 [Paenibacillus sp. LHD-117]|uniref:hypothetical protein n=1 Tax=Paenibacillus sp. LHD-117 TaxID=3071412 RepID=UPI0027E1D923|nr:hypothetical protein [Paenibacillus sp. LHD-117]MDQ6423588.1 hypothetical protein [Paenibacillus sp. LHD-117]
MTDSSSFAYSVLTRLLDYYGSHGITAKLADPDEDAPYASLLIRFEEIGSRNDSLLLEISFIPGLEEAEKEGVYLMQTFAVLRDKTAPASYESLLHACAALNLTLPLGAFGVSENGGALYFKHNAMLRREWLESEQGLQQLDRMNGLVLHQLHQFIDQLVQ